MGRLQNTGYFSFRGSDKNKKNAIIKNMNPDKIIRTAVVGVGHLGQHHARIYSEMPGVLLAAVVDTDEKQGRKIAKQYRTAYCKMASEIIDSVDAVNIATPTVSHYEMAKIFIERGVATFVEKPITADPAQAEELVSLSEKKGVILQIGHVERFNAAVQAARNYIKDPRFIEVDRLSPYPMRSLDIGVVLDLMIHDIDIILSFVSSPVKKIDSMAAAVLSKYEDIANCRIAFENGCVANITASRVSYKAERKFRVFEGNQYITLDFQKQRLAVYRKKSGIIKSVKDIEIIKPRIKKTEPLKSELADFISCVREGRVPEVSGRRGLAALKLVLEIMNSIKEK